MDDILIYSKTLQDHVALLQKVFQILEQHQFLMKSSKCSFAKNTVEYLGHVISEEGVATDKTKIQTVSLWSTPKTIISDRDRVFTSSVWQQLFRLTDTKLMMSSSYHPQMDGQTERLNQCVEGFLRCTVHSCLRQWSKWISVVEFWYNTSMHTALGKSPFEVLYGYTPLHQDNWGLLTCS
jgi:hypothetical protein